MNRSPFVIRLRLPQPCPACMALALVLCASLPNAAMAKTQAAPLPAVQWTSAQQASSGVRIERLAPNTYNRAFAATASVQNPAALLRLQAQVATAQAQLQAAQTRLRLAQLRAQQAEGLYTQGQNMALAEVQQAQAAADTARADVMVAQTALETARIQRRTEAGRALDARLAHDPALRRALSEGRDLIVDLALPPGTRLPAAAHVLLRLPAGDTVALTIIGPAAAASGEVQGLRYAGVVAAAPGLMPGLRLPAEVRNAHAQRGVLVPASAVVWSNGRALVFVAGKASASGARGFAARPVSTAEALAGGYLQVGWGAVDVVTQGSGLLLTPPPKPQAKPAAHDTTAGDDD